MFFCFSKIINGEESEGFCDAKDTAMNNETELVTISANRTSSISTEIIKANVGKAIEHCRQQSPLKDMRQNPEFQKINCKLMVF